MGEPGSAGLSVNRVPPRHESIKPGRRIVTLMAAVVVYLVHFYLDILFRNGPIRPRALIVSGALLGLSVIAAAWLLAIWSRRWAKILAVVYLAGISAFTAIFAYLASHTQG